MRKLFAFLTAFLILALSLCGCSAGNAYGAYSELDEELLSDYDYTRFMGQGIILNVANWGEYMCLNEADMLDVNEAFEALTGIEVNYTTFASTRLSTQRSSLAVRSMTSSFRVTT